MEVVKIYEFTKAGLQPVNNDRQAPLTVFSSSKLKLTLAPGVKDAGRLMTITGVATARTYLFLAPCQEEDGDGDLALVILDPVAAGYQAWGYSTHPIFGARVIAYANEGRLLALMTPKGSIRITSADADVVLTLNGVKETLEWEQNWAYAQFCSQLASPSSSYVDEDEEELLQKIGL